MPVTNEVGINKAVKGVGLRIQYDTFIFGSHKISTNSLDSVGMTLFRISTETRTLVGSI
jgi:hypothetical protein